jgi:hypothetical protein
METRLGSAGPGPKLVDFLHGPKIGDFIQLPSAPPPPCLNPNPKPRPENMEHKKIAPGLVPLWLLRGPSRIYNLEYKTWNINLGIRNSNTILSIQSPESKTWTCRIVFSYPGYCLGTLCLSFVWRCVLYKQNARDFFRALFYIKLRVAARICFSITCYIEGMLAIFFPSWFWYKIKSWDACCINRMPAIFFRTLFYIKLRVAARICFSTTCYIDGMLANFFPSWFWNKIKSCRRVASF